MDASRRQLAVAVGLAAGAGLGLHLLLRRRHESRGEETEDALVTTLLGTGVPRPCPGLGSAATLVEFGDVKILIDAGRCVCTRLAEAGVHPSQLSCVALTHYHSDYVSGLADVLLSRVCKNVASNEVSPTTASAFSKKPNW